MRYPAKKLIKDTQRLIRLKIFLEKEIGVKIDLPTEILKAVSYRISKAN